MMHSTVRSAERRAVSRDHDRRTIALACAAVLSCGSIAGAASITWDGDTSTLFTAAGNWVGGSAPTHDTTTDVAVFASATPNQPSMGTTSSRSVAGLDFQTAGWTLSSGGQTLTIGTSGISSAGSGVNTISAPLNGTSTATWTIANGNTLELSGLISGSATTVTVNGPGKLLFTGTAANTGSQTFVLSNGTQVEFNKSGSGVALGSSTAMTVGNGSTVKWLAASQTNAAADFTVQAGGVLDLNGFNASFAFSGNDKITLSGGTVQTGAGVWSFGGNDAAAAVINGSTTSTITGKVDLNNGTSSSAGTRKVSLSPASSGVALDLQADVTDTGVAGSVGSGFVFSAASGAPSVSLGGNNAYRRATAVGANVTLYADHANALGASGSSLTGTTVDAGGTLALRGGITYADEQVTINYTPTAGLRSVSGNNTWTGVITNPGGSNNVPGVVQVDADRLTVTGSMAAFSSTSRTLAKTGAGALVYNNAANDIAATVYSNGGTLAFTPTGEVNRASGNTVLDGGTIAAPDNITMALGTSNTQQRFGANGGGWAAFGSDINVDVGGTATLVWGGSTAAQTTTGTRTGTVVTSIKETYFGGTGYLSGGSGTIALTVSGGAGTGAAGTATVTNGVITGFTLTNGGTGYTGDPTFSVGSPTSDGGTTNFLANDAPLILNSTISAHKVTLVDNIDLAASSATFTGRREIRVLDNTASSADKAVINGAISSSKSGVGLRKSGAGVLELTSLSNSYSGVTDVEAGRLLVTGAVTGAGQVTVSEGAFLAGTGSVAGHVSLAADSADANSTGGGIAIATATDPLALGGDLTLGLGSVLDLTGISGLDSQTIYTLIDYAGTRVGSFASFINLPSTHSVTYDNANGLVQLTPVPEPALVSLLGIGACGVLIRRRSRAD